MEIIQPDPSHENPQAASEFAPPPASPAPPAYTPPPVPQAPVVSIGDWFVTLLLLCIPVVNFIMLIVWAFGGAANPGKANFARAALIWLLISVVVMIMFASSMISMMQNLMSY